MIKILLNGINGRMGKTIENLSLNYDNLKISCGVDNVVTKHSTTPTYQNINDVKEDVDVIIDFSHPNSLDELLDYAIKNKIGIVLCTTGHTKEQLEKIKNASKEIPIFMSYNMSIGINVLQILIQKGLQALYKDYDIEITEKHHNQKLDSPSGTAIMLMNTIQDFVKQNFNEEVIFNHGRLGEKKREAKEIGVHAIRAGNIIGEHEVMFAGNNEIIELKHTALSRDVFAQGALKAALYLHGKEPKIYDMNSMLNL